MGPLVDPAKVDVTSVIHGALEFKLAKGAFEIGKEMGKCLRIVPDVGAGTCTATAINKTPFPAPDVTIVLAQEGRGFENAEVGGDGVKDV